MQGHHRALAEADQRKVGIGQAILFEFSVDEAVNRGSGGGCTRRQCLGRNAGQRPPLVARVHPGSLRSVGSQEQGVGNMLPPLRGQRDHVCPARAISMQKQDDLLGLVA